MCALTFLRLSNVQREARTVEGVHLLSFANRIKSFIHYEGTNIILLEAPSGQQIEIWYGDNRSEFGRPPADMQVRRLGSVRPICREAIDYRLKFPRELSFLQYAQATEFRSDLSDFESLMKNLDRAEQFVSTAFGQSEIDPRAVVVGGVTYRCFVTQPGIPQ
jgi:hypothetical protein